MLLLVGVQAPLLRNTNNIQNTAVKKREFLRGGEREGEGETEREGRERQTDRLRERGGGVRER